MKNSYEIRGDVTAIFVCNKGIPHETLIDTVDLELAKSHTGTWNAWWDKTTNSFYVRGTIGIGKGKRKAIHLHRWVMDETELLIDHINHDSLDNRRSVNLRAVTATQNQLNRKGAQKNSTSGVLGVSWQESRGLWRARFKVNREYKYVGYHPTKEEAEQAIIKERSKYIS